MAKTAKASAQASDVATELLIDALNGVVVEMIEAKCGELNKRDRNTLKRHIRKAVEAFVKDRAT
jgi:hypothetical protein